MTTAPTQSDRPRDAGFFLTLEGGDGAGKSTQAALLESWLQERGHRVLRTREPGGTPLGEQIRQMVLHERGHIAPRAEALLYAADRAHHVETVVRPALDDGIVVVQDRYIDSSVAYQGVARHLGDAMIRTISNWAADNLQPDLTVVLDIDPAIGRGRMTRSRGGLDRLEREAVAFHTAVRDAFLAMAGNDPDRFLVLDATRPAEDLGRAIQAAVAARLPAAHR
ncbi:dTMP kinase [Curtobacterium ammoniigenes]|uniref:dTMP kinase n=1 Tax=Curtobacterium ammoniigenes TaxID=395387 RepID=UPI0008340DBB|nr:dTMP kinase [Curtobacterium ammoniigenes]